MRERYFDVCENSASLRNDFLPKTSSSDLIDPKKNSTDQPKLLSAKKKFGDIVIAEKISNQNELSENRNSGNILLMKHSLIGDVTVVKICLVFVKRQILKTFSEKERRSRFCFARVLLTFVSTELKRLFVRCRL